MQERMEHVEKQWVVPSQTTDSNGAGTLPATTRLGGGGGIGGDGIGGASRANGGLIAGNRNESLADAERSRQVEGSNSGTLAWDDSGVNRSLSEPQASADRKYYRKPAVGETENKRLSADGPVQPAFENSTFASAPAPAQMPAPVTTSAPVVAGTFRFNTAARDVQQTLAFNDTQQSPLQSRVQNSGTPVTAPPGHSLDDGEFTFGAANDASKTSPATGEPNWVGTLNNPDTPHGQNNHFISRYAYTAPTTGALDQVQSTNYMAINGVANNTFNPGVSAIAPEVTYDLTPQEKLGVPASDNEILSSKSPPKRRNGGTG